MTEISNHKTKKESNFIAFIKGIGCFFFSFISFLTIFILVIFYFITPIISNIRIQQELPNFEGPNEQDFWSLQEKKLGKSFKDNLIDQSFNLTSGEYNAFLSSIRITTTDTFCLLKVRHTFKDKELRYYLIGSGYTLKRLVISFVLSNDGNNTFISEITLNSWKVPGSSLYERYIISIIKDLAKSDKSGILDNIISGKIKPKLE